MISLYIFGEYMQCTYKISEVRSHSQLPWKIQYYIFWVCVCSLNYPASNAHASYYIVIRELSGSTLFIPIIS